jgi:nucleotidyltransferase/DNA polymerase involved in DNA repair
MRCAISPGRPGGYSSLHELARGIDDREVVPDKPTKSISVENTFDHDVPLAQTESMIRSLAEKLWSAARKEPRIARTIVLKLKTSEFKIPLGVSIYRPCQSIERSH